MMNLGLKQSPESQITVKVSLSVEEDSNYQDVLDVKMHSLELSNWLNFAD